MCHFLYFDPTPTGQRGRVASALHAVNCPYEGLLYEEALPKRCAFFRLQEYESVGFSQVEIYEKSREICHLVILKGLELKLFFGGIFPLAG